MELNSLFRRDICAVFVLVLKRSVGFLVVARVHLHISLSRAYADA